MFVIFFDLISFFDLQKWVPMEETKKRKKSATTWDREIEKNSTVWKVEKWEKKKKERKKEVLDCMKLEYYKEVLDFSNIEYYIIFLITQIPGQ